MIAQHIHNAYCGQTDTEEVGALRHAGSDEESAVASALDGEIVL